jgi:AcrR family transcriptional regulator
LLVSTYLLILLAVPTPAPRLRKPGGDRRREIADAALRVIAAHGLGRFTALAIAREVGLTDGALFRHFASKEAIVDAAIDRVEELLFESFPPRDEDPVARLGAFFARRVAVIREHQGVSQLVASEELDKAGSAQGVARVAELRRRSTAFVRGCLDEAGRAGLLAPGLGPDEASIVVLGALLALAHAPTSSRAEAVAPVAARVWRALESFLRGPRARGRNAGCRPPRRAGRPTRRR